MDIRQSKLVAVSSAIALALLIAPNYALASPNLITNGNFESGTTGWTSLSCGAGLEISASPGTYGIPAAPNGPNFVEVECNNLTPTSTADYVQQTVTTVVGETYIVSAQATTRAGVNSQDKMIINAAGSNIASVTTGNTWVKYAGSYVAGATSSVIRYVSNGSVTGFTQPGDSNGLMLDDAQVQELTVSPTSATTAEDISITFSSGGGNGFQVATNSTAATLTVSFSVTNGKLTLASTTGLTFTIGANGSASFTFTGTAAAINTALNTGITYAPTADYNGADTISFTATAGAASDTDTVPVTITPVADIVADSVTTPENSAITYNAITGTNGASADNFENTPSAVSVTVPSHGTAVASLVTLGQITYTPTAGWFGTDTFTYTVTSGGVTETATETVIVAPLNPLLQLSKTTTGGTGSFTFTGNNGWTSQAIATVTIGTAVSGTQQTLTAAATTTTITEALAVGYQLTSATCTDTNSVNTGNPASFGSVSGNVLTIPAANVIKGAAISCSFSNAKIPTMKVQKLTRGKSGGPFTFTQTGLASAPAAITTSTLAAEPTVPTAINAAIGTAITLTETVDPNYVTAGVSCSDANSAITGNAAPITSAIAAVTLPAANVKAGADYTCLFTNDRIPTVKVQKSTIGAASSPSTFSFTTTGLTGSISPIATTIAATPTPAVPTALTGTLATIATITESTVVAGYSIAGVSCSDANSAVTGNAAAITSATTTVSLPAANMKAGADYTCLFTNTKLPTITLTKISLGNVGGFTFTGNNGFTSQTITTVTSGTGVAGANQILTAASTATTIVETIPGGYTVTAITCSGLGAGGTATPTLGTGTVALDTAATTAGSNIACTYTNTKTPTMKVQKLTRGKSGGPFSFTQTGLASTPAAITTSTLAAEPTVPTAINATISTAVTLNETVDPNYVTAGVSCADANSAITGNAAPTTSATASVTVLAANIKAGADYTCLFTNDRIPTVKVQKTTLGGFGGPFSFTTTNMATTPSNITTVAASTPTPAAPTANNVSTISNPVTINEPAIGGFFLSNATCTDANSAITGNSGSFTSLAGSTLTIPGANVKAGADFTCVFSNTKGAPNLTVVKTASPSGPFSAGQTITYTYTVTNSGNVAVANVTVGDTHNGTGVFTGPNSEILTTDVAPAGDSSDGTANNGVWSLLGVGDTVTFNATYVVTQHDVDFLQ